jgi:Tfp pilus assembly protein PilZ
LGKTVRDRRKYRRLRYGVDIEVTYYRKKAGGTEITSRLRTENVSAGGIRVTARNRFKVDTVVSVRLTMPYTGEEIACFAQVVWVSPVEEGKFDTGLAFVNLSGKEIAAIDRFVEEELDKGIE